MSKILLYTKGNEQRLNSLELGNQYWFICENNGWKKYITEIRKHMLYDIEMCEKLNEAYQKYHIIKLRELWWTIWQDLANQPKYENM